MTKYSLTNPQNSIWLTEKFYTGTAINNISGYTYITEKVNFDVLKDAINEIIKTNDNMRLKFKEENNSCVQFISEYKPFDIEIIELSSEKDIKEKALELARIPFKVENSLLFKFTLFKLPNNYGGYFLSAHHLIGDSWGLGLIVKEIANTYGEMVNKHYEEITYPSYKNYIENEKQYLSSDKYIKDQEYWDEIFKTVPETATIPSCKKVSTTTSCNGNRISFNIAENEINIINDFCKENKISLYNFFMAIYSLYVGRVSSLDDFVIGTPILNRTNFEQKQTAGMFISTAPLRINLNHNLSFSEFVKNIASNTLSLFRHQKYPYQSILENLRKKDSSIPNLYNVILSYQITKTFDEEAGFKYKSEWLSNGFCADDLQIHLFDLNDESSITVAYDYKTDKYDDSDISDLHARILTIINQIIDNNNILLKDIEIVTPEEKHKILYEFNNTQVDYPKDKTIVDLFEEQVEKTPDNIAVVFEDQKLTYKELNKKANQLARYLIDNNVKPGDIVGILFERSLEMIISILAVLKTGAAYLPLDPSYPHERLDYIFKDCKLKYILTNNSFYSDVFNNTILYNKDSLIFKNINITNLNINIPNSSTAYLIYTSGSTGTPKGIALRHISLTNLIYYCNNNIEYLKNPEYISIVSITTISFDIFIFETLVPLQRGLKVVIANSNQQTLPFALDSLILKENIQAIQATPSRMQIFLNNINAMNNFNNLKYITLAGEPLSLKLTQALHSISGATIYNGYGPSETTVFATLTDVTKKEKCITIGKPLSNSKIYILDQNKNLCPIGISGEIYISGDPVGFGYINRPSLTKASFVLDKFFNNCIMYKSGDLGYFTYDGEIVCLGRLDNQIKIRGLRVELQEIESLILDNSNIKNCVVSKISSPSGNDNLCAYYVKNKNFDITDLKKSLSQKLPNYMLPEYWVELDSFPYTPNGKIDRKALPIPKYNPCVTFENSRNNVDAFIVQKLSTLLNIKNISILDSFFHLGGDSLTAISLSTSIFNEFNVCISVQNIFDNPVIMDLSDYISELSNTSKNKIKVQEKKEYYPLSSAQKRMYYSSSIDNNSTLYNIAGGIILDKNIDINKLDTCFKTLINRHDILRTRFEIRDNDIVQIIDDNIDFKLDIENSNCEDLNKIYTSFVKPFDLSKAPLFRAKVVNLKDNKMLLLLDMHHIISDGTSLNILLQELCTLYNNGNLSNKEIDYKDFTIWEQEQFSSEEFNKSKEFWVNQFKNDEIPLLNMPTTFPRPSVQSFEGNNYHTKLSKSISDKINAVAQELQITPYMLMLSAYYILLSKYTSQDDIVVGSPIIGRDLPELSNVLGMFVNTLALRNKINHSLTFEEFSKEIKENCLESFKNQNYPFDMLVKDLDIKRDTSRSPLFDTMFVFQNNGYPTINIDGIKTEYFIPDNNVSKFDLTLEVVPLDSEYTMRFEYCTKLFDDEFIKRLSTHYINILNAILENKEIKISDIEMLSEEEKNQILYEFNNTKVDYPKDKTIVDLFEEQVEKTPDNIAVVFEDQKLTYKELNEKSNQLARYLIDNGVKDGDVVSILLDKSLEMILSIISILKVGGAFLPIDINYPADRIDYIIRDSKSKVLLTKEKYIYKSNNTIKPLCFDLDNSKFLKYDINNLNINYNSDNLTYIMYTSGSTGKPKGVMVSNKNIVRLVKNNKFISFDKNEHILQTGSIVFDACTFEIWGALLNGFKLFIIKKEALLEPTLFEKYLDKNKITTLWLTSPLFNQLSEANPYMFKNVNKLLTGGDVLSPKHINAVKKACPNLTIINGYGPTENTTFSCCFTIDKNYSNSIPIGKPISNSTAYIVSSLGNLCPIGVPGELWVGGDGVAKGYLNNDDLTKEKFILNTFGDGIIYKTGDLVKWLPDGNIEFIGRIDNQVKIRGFRIELSEINTKIADYPPIKECATMIKEEKLNKSICSYIVSDQKIDIQELKQYLKKFLPTYMIPTYFVQLDKLPINANGKIDKTLLPNNFNSSKYTGKIKQPTTDTEKILLDIFKKILSFDDIGITDDFFELGGDSLSAIKLQVEAKSNNLFINYSDIFEHSTVKELASCIEQKNNINSNKRYDVNYDIYNSILQKNIITPDMKIPNTPIGNVLLTGFTGFLGAHVLDSFIKKEKGTIYCLIRGKNNMSPEDRLINTLHFYFDTKYDKYIGNRIKIIEGDITQDNLGLNLIDYNILGTSINTVIHCAALVKHYGNYKDFENINILGTKRIIDFSIDYRLKLLHISTISVSGNNLAEGSNIDNNFDQEKEFDETNFYIGQNLNNFYVRSKFEAENLVLDAISNGLQACILRMGNLTSRYSEGKFQQNHFENAFVNRFKSFLQIGIFPKSLLNLYCEFTPIDYCGDAIISVANHFNPDYTVFHLLNEKQVYLDRLFEMLQKLGIHTKLVSDNEFSNLVKEFLQDDSKKHYLEGIINDLTSEQKLVYKSDVTIKSDFTKEFLSKIGFEWPYIDINYIRNYFKYLTDIGYFNLNIN